MTAPPSPPVIFGLAAVDGLQRQRVPEDKRDPFWRTQVSEPVPGEETGDADDESVPRGRDGFEERHRAGLHIPVEQGVAVLLQDIDIHGAGMQVDAAGCALDEEAHRV